MAHKTDWIRLGLALEAGSPYLPKVLEQFPDPALAFRPEAAEALPFLPPGVREQWDQTRVEDAEMVLRRCEEQSIAVITLEEEAYPDLLRHVFSPPPVLYMRGKMPSFPDTPTLGIVGTRKAHYNGAKASYDYAAALARKGFCIVSGLAEGIDARAHAGCLAAGGPTIAVLGTGVDICYPRCNKDLYYEILKTGAIVSEYPPGTGPKPKHFPTRNRIIAGLSLGVLMIEVPQRSGARITGNLALENGRDVFVIPGGDSDPAYEGSREFIRDGCKIVNHPDDILGAYDYTLYYEETTEETSSLQLSPVEQKIWEVLQGRRRIEMEDLFSQVDLPHAQILSALMMMEVRELIQSDGLVVAIKD